MLLRGFVITLAACAWLVPVPASWVERYYSRGVFARVQPIVTGLSNRVPFALFDVILVAAAALLLVATVQVVARAWRKRAVSPVARFGLDMAALAAIVYLVFLGMWGFNYRREPLASRLATSDSHADSAAVLRLGHVAVERLNQLNGPAHREGFPEWDELRPALESGYLKVQQRLLPGSGPRAGVPKWSMLSYFFARSGVSGMTDPFFLEVLVDRDLLPFERPFVLAHEWAHLAGYADEAEANFVGWLSCVNGGAPAAYSGWLYLYAQTLTALPAGDRVALVRALGPGPRADLTAVAERARRIQPVLRAVSWRVYDRYLKANRVEAGIASYDRALLLVLHARFTEGWMPLVTD